MKPTTKTITLTLVVATTPITHSTTKPLLGIGLNGTLPWPRIKSDMNFFARVTSRPPPPQETSPEEAETGNKGKKEKLNAIIMGRKTYYSLPKSLRPLKDRLNVVISRDESGSVAAEVERDLARQREKAEKDGKEGDKRDAVVAHGLEDALKQLFDEQRQDLGHVFVIGGGEIYRSSLELSSTLTESRIVQRILMTRVKRRDSEEYECDTFFPLTDEDLSSSNTKGWRQAGAEEVTSWVGERVGEEWIEEGEVAIKVEGYERA
ncbi:dihydrofolate reductase [Talaromyces pinophilus]|uniref:Dihydrofolate reductase n=1 Tax=Talaromyces pinophilus TaxID=128442 RepID=A0A6V8H4K3_TALPI|nr:dihydrofolate reductase [Talaromyces pinophilus]